MRPSFVQHRAPVLAGLTVSNVSQRLATSSEVSVEHHLSIVFHFQHFPGRDRGGCMGGVNEIARHEALKA